MAAAAMGSTWTTSAEHGNRISSSQPASAKAAVSCTAAADVGAARRCVRRSLREGVVVEQVALGVVPGVLAERHVGQRGEPRLTVPVRFVPRSPETVGAGGEHRRAAAAPLIHPIP